MEPPIEGFFTVSKISTRVKVVHPLSGKVKKRASFDELLLAGIQVLAEKGIDHTSVSDVATESGVSRPTFYTYFGDMNGFYAEVWLRFGQEWLNSQVDESVAVDANLDQVVLEIFSASRRIPEVFEVVQPDFERWWQEQNDGNAIKAQRLVWQLGFKLGFKLARKVTPKAELGIPVELFLNLPENAMDIPTSSGLGAVTKDLLPPMAGLTKVDDSVESSLTMATIEVISASGVAAASMTRIARRARVSTGSVYPRFKNAESLIQSSFVTAIAGIVQRNVEVVAARGIGIDEYALTVNAGFGENRKVWRNFRTEMHIEAAHNPELAAFMVSGFEKASKFLEDSFIQFGVGKTLANSIAWFLHSHAIGISLIYNVLPEIDQIDYRIMARWMVSQLPK
jgi:AcrR family transcriptional regulator